MSTKAAITWASNAAWAATGYGTQTRQAVTRLIADGHKIVVAANYGIEATNTEWDGIEHWSRGYDPYSQDMLTAYWRDWSRQHPDLTPLLVTLYDVWVYTNPALDNVPIASWVPIDHMPIPPKVAQWCAKPNVTPLAMSRYGQAQLERAGLQSLYVPHAIETDVYQPTATFADATGTQRTGRELMDLPAGYDGHVTGIINANKGTTPVRKAFAEQLLAWSIFAKDKGDDVMLYLHTDRHGGMGGIAFDPLIESVGLQPEQYRFVNQYLYRTGIPADAMAALYTDLDVLLAATLGEGFGLTVAEAGACGTRSIANNFTAQPELVSDGWLVDGQPLWDPAQEAWFNTPSVVDMVRALNESYERRDERHSQAARDHIVANYDADDVFDRYWRPAIELLVAP